MKDTTEFPPAGERLGGCNFKRGITPSAQITPPVLCVRAFAAAGRQTAACMCKKTPQPRLLSVRCLQNPFHRAFTPSKRVPAEPRSIIQTILPSVDSIPCALAADKFGAAPRTLYKGRANRFLRKSEWDCDRFQMHSNKRAADIKPCARLNALR